MKNLKERTLARQVLRAKLGFAPALENIVPLESSGHFGQCNYVLFQIKNHDDILYRANIDGYLSIEKNGKEINL